MDVEAMITARLAGTGLKLRSRDPGDRAEAWLELEGVNLAHARRRAQDAEDAASSRTRVAAEDIRGRALDLKRAEAQLLSEARGYSEGATGFTSATLAAAEDRAARTAASLDEACCHDHALARAARRAAG